MVGAYSNGIDECEDEHGLGVCFFWVCVVVVATIVLLAFV